MSPRKRGLIDDATLEESREPRMPAGPRLGRTLLLAVGAVLALGYLFTFVPPLLSPALDLGALGMFGLLAVRGMLGLARRALR